MARNLSRANGSHPQQGVELAFFFNSSAGTLPCRRAAHALPMAGSTHTFMALGDHKEFGTAKILVCVKGL